MPQILSGESKVIYINPPYHQHLQGLARDLHIAYDRNIVHIVRRYLQQRIPALAHHDTLIFLPDTRPLLFYIQNRHRSIPPI